MNLLKIKSVVTLGLLSILGVMLLIPVLKGQQPHDMLLAAFVGGIGLCFGALYGKKDSNNGTE